MATNKKSKTVEPDAIEESKSAHDLEDSVSNEELIKDVVDLLPAPTKLRIRQQNSLMRLSRKLVPLFEDVYELDENGEPVRDEDGNILVRDGADRFEIAETFMDITEAIDEFCESIAFDADAYIAWAEGKSNAHFMALFTYFRSTVGE